MTARLVITSRKMRFIDGASVGAWDGIWGAAGQAQGARSIPVAFFLVVLPVVVVIVIFVIVLIPVIVLVFFLLFLVVVLVRAFAAARPALRLLDLLEVHFMPGVQIQLLDVAIEIFDLDQFGVLVHGQHTEGFVFLHVLIPLSLGRFVISAHCNSCAPLAVWILGVPPGTGQFPPCGRAPHCRQGGFGAARGPRLRPAESRLARGAGPGSAPAAQAGTAG